VLAIAHTLANPCPQEFQIPIYAIKGGNVPSLTRAFRTLLGVDPSAGGSFVQKSSNRGGQVGIVVLCLVLYSNACNFSISKVGLHDVKLLHIPTDFRLLQHPCMVLAYLFQ